MCLGHEWQIQGQFSQCLQFSFMYFTFVEKMLLELLLYKSILMIHLAAAWAEQCDSSWRPVVEQCNNVSAPWRHLWMWSLMWEVKLLMDVYGSYTCYISYF